MAANLLVTIEDDIMVTLAAERVKRQEEGVVAIPLWRGISALDAVQLIAATIEAGDVLIDLGNMGYLFAWAAIEEMNS